MLRIIWMDLAIEDTLQNIEYLERVSAAFNRLATLSTNGLKLSNVAVENFGFE